MLRLLAAPLLAVGLAAHALADEPPSVTFEDVTEQTGLRDHLHGIQSHLASFGDVTGNGLPDLLIGAWGEQDLRGHRHYDAPGPPVPGRLYYNRDGRFVHDPDSGIPDLTGHITAGVFVDLNNNGHLDLYLTNHRGHERNQLFRNDGDGRFTEITDSVLTPDDGLTSRSIGVLDYDGSGRIDLLVLEGDRPPQRSRLYRNLGDFAFEDVTDEAGLPADLAGLGVGVGDLTGNGYPDLLITNAVSRRGDGYDWGERGEAGARVFLNDAGTFTEAEHLRPMFQWPRETYDDKPCGVVFGDLNNNGRLDIVLGHHDSRPWRTPKAIRVYLNDGLDDDGELVLRDVTEQAGFAPLGTKAPHVEIRDFANRGAPDVYTSIVRRHDNGDVEPVIYHRVDVDADGVPRFVAPALEDLDFPRAEHADMSVHEIAATAPLRYYGFGPVGDFDADGRLDVLLVTWWPQLESHLLRNTTDNGNRHLGVRVEGVDRLNRMGIGAKVSVYEPGGLGDDAALIGFAEIATGYGYSSGQEAIAHFGLGQRDRCDVRVELPHGGPTIERTDVEANQTITLVEPR